MGYWVSARSLAYSAHRVIGVDRDRSLMCSPLAELPGWAEAVVVAQKPSAQIGPALLG